MHFSSSLQVWFLQLLSGVGLLFISELLCVQQHKMEEEAMQYSFGIASTSLETEEPRRKRYKKDAYFSDEEELDDS